jgi:hypothetical protein
MRGPDACDVRSGAACDGDSTFVTHAVNESVPTAAMAATRKIIRIGPP